MAQLEIDEQNEIAAINKTYSTALQSNFRPKINHDAKALESMGFDAYHVEQ